MGEDEEVVGAEGSDDDPGHLRRVHALGDDAGQVLVDELLVLGELGRQMIRPVPLGVGGDIGVDHSRTEHRGLDVGPDGLEIVSQRLGGGEGRELRNGVGGFERGPEQTGHRGGIDHMALGPLGDHPGDERPDAVEDPPQVDPQDELQVGHRPFPDQAADEHPGVVAHHVHLVPPFEHRVGQGVDRGRVAHVAAVRGHFDRREVGADLVCGPGQ